MRQLFIVDFEGHEITEESPIYQLVTRYNVGGVVLKESNNNIPYGEDALMDTWALIDSLQNAEIDYSSRLQEDPNTGGKLYPSPNPPIHCHRTKW